MGDASPRAGLPFAAGFGAVEVRIGEQGLRRIRTRLEEILLRSGELEVVLADILQAALPAEVAAGLVAGGDGKLAGLAVEGFQRLPFGIAHRDVFAFHEGHGVSPLARLVGRKMRAPFRPGLGGSVRRIAVGGEVTGHSVLRRTGFVREGHGHPVVREGIRLVVALVRERSVEGQRDLVPLLEFAGDGDCTLAIGLAGLDEWRERFRRAALGGGVFVEIALNPFANVLLPMP